MARKDHINHRSTEASQEILAATHKKREFLYWVSNDEMFRDELLAALGLGLVVGELKQLEDRVTALENKQRE